MCSAKMVIAVPVIMGIMVMIGVMAMAAVNDSDDNDDGDVGYRSVDETDESTCYGDDGRCVLLWRHILFCRGHCYDHRVHSFVLQLVIHFPRSLYLSSALLS